MTANQDQEARAQFAGAHRACEYLSVKFADTTFRTYLEANRHGDLGSVSALYLRVAYWMRTFAKLAPEDFQAIMSGTRTLLEIGVDLSLRAGDPASYDLAKMAAWELSARLKQAQKIAASIGPNPTDPDDAARKANYDAFIANEQGGIESERSKYWPSPKTPGTGAHPARWTGQDLVTDAARADKFDSKWSPWFAVVCNRAQHRTLREHADEKYGMLNWGTHGSSLTLARHLSVDDLVGLGAVVLHDATTLALRVCGLTLEAFRAPKVLFDELIAVARQSDSEQRRIYLISGGTP